MTNNKSQPEKIDLGSMNITENQKHKLKQVFPEVFNEDKIDWEKLKLTLGEQLDKEPEEERFGMNWPGKSECFRVIQEPSVGTLKPCREESVDWEHTENLFIEGDNLEVLKLLQKAYYGKVKMIYIDPPYNTGKEFIYPDKFSETLETYLAYTGQTDAQGRKFSTNTESDGRFHSKWMNMMYPRLFLARNLLRDDGVIFISIDDNEVKNLRSLMDEVFGEENFKSDISWQKRYTRSNNTVDFTTVVEHILIYAKSESFEVKLLPRTDEADARYTNPDNDPRGPWISSSYVNPAKKESRPNLVYKIENPVSGKIVEHPTHAWKFDPKTYSSHVKENRLYWGLNDNNEYPRLKSFLSETRGLTPINFWAHTYAGNTDDGIKNLGSVDISM